MLTLTFRQGIASYETLPLYLQLDSGGATLTVTSKPVKIAFAHGIADYLYIESTTIKDAWAGLNSTDNFWLYWDIDLITAQRTFGTTMVAPTYGSAFPSSPAIDQHYFNLPDMKMYFFNGQTWVECVRLFAGSLMAGKLGTEPLGTQVNSYITYNIGTIVFDIYGKPLKKFTDAGFVFLTTADDLQPSSTNLNSISMSMLDLSGISSTYIPKFYCVKAVGRDDNDHNLISAASFMDINNAAFAITSVEMFPGQVKQLITRGFIQDMTFNFRYPPQTPLFVGGAGEITPFANNLFSIQKIGHIVSTNTIYISVGRQILIS